MKNLKYLLFVFSFLFSVSIVYAKESSCSSSVLKSISTEANYVKVDYEIRDESSIKTLQVGDDSTEYRIPNYKFDITIMNMTENLYANIRTTKANQDYEEGYSIHYEDTIDGAYTFVDDNFGDIYNYVITIMSDNENCEEKTIRTIKFTKPRYNAFSEYKICQNSSIFYCQRFIGTEVNITTDDFLKKIEPNNKRNEELIKPKKQKSVLEIFKSNWKLYLIIFISIASLTIAVLTIMKSREKKKGWRL